MYPETTAGFPGFAFPACYLQPVWLPIAMRWRTRGGKIACSSPIESVVVCSQLSPCVGGLVRYGGSGSSAALIRQTGGKPSVLLMPPLTGCSETKRQMRARFPLRRPLESHDNSKGNPRCCPLIVSNSNICIILVTAHCLVGSILIMPEWNTSSFHSTSKQTPLIAYHW